MATYTREQLVKSVLGELCQVDPNEDVEGADFNTVNIACQSMLEELYEDGKIPFDIDGVIPARYFQAITWKVTRTLVNTYSAQDREQAIVANDLEADKKLNRLVQGGYIPTVTQGEYF